MSDKRLTLELVTPEKMAWSAPADFVVLPALGGEMGVLPGHQSFLVQLAPGEVRVTVGSEVKTSRSPAALRRSRTIRCLSLPRRRRTRVRSTPSAPAQALEKAKAVVKPGLDPMQLAQMEAAIHRAQVRLRVSRRGKTPPPHVD